MLSLRKSLWTAVTLVLLGVAGYAQLNPAFAAACKSAYDTGSEWGRQQASSAGAVFKRTAFYASVTQEMRALEVRIAARKRASAATIAQQQADAAAHVQRLGHPFVSKWQADRPSVSESQPVQASTSSGQRIANGHAFSKHGGEFGFSTADQMASHVDRVVGHAQLSDVKHLRNGRTAYWDEATRSVVIVDPNTHDGGTAFKPRRGRSYFEALQ